MHANMMNLNSSFNPISQRYAVLMISEKFIY